MQKSKTHWPSILILLVLIPGLGLFLISALGFGVSSIFSLLSKGDDPAGAMIAAFAAGLESFILAGCAWFVFQKTRDLGQVDINLRIPFRIWHIFAGLGVILFALIIGSGVSYSNIKWLSWLFLPLLTILVITPPIWILLGIGTQGLDFGPRWRALGVFGLGMTLGPLIMIITEIILAAIFVIGIALFLVSKPDIMQEIIRLSGLIQKETDPDTIVTLLAPYIIKPGVIIAAISFFSLLVPMIEEMFKPLGIWLFASGIDTPAQGFALGLLSGAAYALVESLGASGQGGESWPVVVSVRAGTSLLHILTTGLMGWAIVAAWRERRFFRLSATYGTVILIHGLWNASAISAGFATVADSLGESNFIVSILPAAICGMAVIGIGLIAVLITSNQRARKLYPLALGIPKETPAIQNIEGIK